jgi:hypothetical protein
MSSKVDIDKRTSQLWDTHWRDIEQARANKKLVLVEGDDDKLVLEALLRSRDPLFTSKVYVGVAGDRNRVLKRLQKYRDTYGLVDRDTWNDSDIVDAKSTRPMLRVTTGWCIENHFCMPNALSAALNIDLALLNREIAIAIPEWYRYCAIWWIVHRFRDDLLKSLPNADCGHPANDPCPDEATLRARLGHYGSLLPNMAVDHIVAAVAQRERDVAAIASVEERMEKAIHGKLFFKEVVVGVLNRQLRQRDTASWRVEIAERLGNQWPAYLVQFADELLRP